MTRNRTRRSQGFALIIVLGVLVLICILILGYISTVRTNLSSTATYANGSSARALSDDVVQLVMGQIQDATTGPVDSGGTPHKYPGSPFSWASQPGMIRTYDTSGKGIMFYKLYSSDSMRTVWQDAGSYASTAGMKDDLLASDLTDTAQFTDLNSPVDNGAGTQVYPIADPNSLSVTSNPSATNPVQGFSTTGTVPTNVAGSSSNPYLPMPVRWIYVLQDGTLAAAPSGSNGTINLASAGASATNPIVGRIAFWTDDETSKVNINTAAEGTYWDKPRFWGSVWPSGPGNPAAPALTGSPSYNNPYRYPELAYAISQPALYEFARYPGHPAQVALSPIFPNLASTAVGASGATATAQTMANLAPFLAFGGSEGGTQSIDQVFSRANGGIINLVNAGRKSLYDSGDELLFGTGALASGNRPLTNPANITSGSLAAAKFFVTSNSRAPELNLFGLPRIACWPIDSSFDLISNPQSPYTSAFDRLIAFCSSLKTSASAYAPYYFKRTQPNPSAPATSNDYTNNSRNSALYSYLQSLTSQPVPGFGSGTFTNKYSVTDRDQILTEIFDYIRCTDLLDPNLPTAAYDFASRDSGDTGGNVYPVTPIIIGSTMGFGRTMVITQAGFCFICMIDGSQITKDPTTKVPILDPNGKVTQKQGTTLYEIPDYGAIMTAAGQSPTGPIADTTKILQAAFVMQGFNPGYGNPVTKHNFYVSVGGLDGNLFGGTKIFNIPNYNLGNQLLSITYSGIQRGEIVSPSIIANPGSPGYYVSPKVYAYSNPANPPTNGPFYPYVSLPFMVNGTTFSFTPNQITIQMYVGPTSSNGKLLPPQPQNVNPPLAPSQVYQTLTFTPPGGNFPVPSLDVNTPAPTNPTLPAGTGYSPPPSGWSFASRIPTNPYPWYSYVLNGGHYDQPLWGDQDVVETFSLAGHGDWRLIAANPNYSVAATSVFTLPNYGSPSDTHSHHMYIELGYMPIGYPGSTIMQQLGSSTLIPNLPASLNQQNVSYGEGGLMRGNIYPLDGEGSHAPNTPWIGDPPGSGTVAAEGPSAATLGDLNCYRNGDFDNFISDESDGPGVNHPDEGDTNTAATPYMLEYASQNVTRGLTFFTPNRIMPSPGMFGSLPTGVKSNPPVPWQTLLFRPQPAVNGQTQVAAASGAGAYYAHTMRAQPDITTAYNTYSTIPDHLFLDLFWMPIVEPYAISDSFSTAGKINMNYQIEPFTYIDRNTALVCLLKPEKLIAVPDNTVDYYKSSYPPTASSRPSNFRFDLNTSETNGSLRQMRARFDAGDIFRSASEICDIFLTPYNDENGLVAGWTNDTAAAQWWASHRLTGDDSREKPYTDLYGHLTTKSNTFTIHMRVQSLKQSTVSRAAGKWIAGQDSVVGEYRGSTLIERYLDPSATYTDYATSPASANLDTLYKFRVVRSTQFSP